MTQRIIETPWADTGAITDPGASKTATGWITEIPTHQNFNWLLNRADEAIQNNQETGIEPWHALVIFQDQGLTMGSDGLIYQSQQVSNLNHQPVGDSGVWWRQPIILPNNHITGLLPSINATTPLFKLDIGGGECRNTGNTSNITLPSTLIKSINVDWVDGDDQGGFPSGLTLTTDTWYRVFAIGKLGIFSGDAGVDIDPDAVNLLADAVANGYDTYRQVAWIRTFDVTPSILPFYISPNDRDFVRWNSPIRDTNASSWTTSAVSRSATVPPGSIAVLNNHLLWGAGADTFVSILVSPLAAPAITPTSSIFTYLARQELTGGVDTSDNVALQVEVDASSQYRWQAHVAVGSGVTLQIATLGYRYARGRN